METTSAPSRNAHFDLIPVAHKVFLIAKEVELENSNEKWFFVRTVSGNLEGKTRECTNKRENNEIW